MKFSYRQWHFEIYQEYSFDKSYISFLTESTTNFDIIQFLIFENFFTVKKYTISRCSCDCYEGENEFEITDR